MIRVSELEEKEIVNVIDGRRLGNVCDVELDLNSGKVRGLVLTGVTVRRRREQQTIPWQEVKKIGLDTVLVEVYAREPNRPLLLEEDYH